METFALELIANEWMLIADGAAQQFVGLQLDASAPCAIAIMTGEPELAHRDWLKLSKDGDASFGVEIAEDRKVYARSLTEGEVVTIRGYREAR
ncbi:MAG: hypothetical protein INR68_03430 [Methylobacterium mesophilicum]|nr:hypothetical protein [Methylobacterium mesophilicum]